MANVKMMFGNLSAEYDPESDHITLGSGGRYVTVGGLHLSNLFAWFQDELHALRGKPALVTPVTDQEGVALAHPCEGDECPTEENTTPDRFAKIGDLAPKFPPKGGE